MRLEVVDPRTRAHPVAEGRVVGFVRRAVLSLQTLLNCGVALPPLKHQEPVRTEDVRTGKGTRAQVRQDIGELFRAEAVGFSPCVVRKG